MHYLYRITNQINGKIYIGQTIEPKKRWYQHRRDSASPKLHLHYAIRKYGAENFIFEVIATCQTLEDADYTETFLIQQYDSRNSEKGYNIKPGGNTVGHSEETKQKIREKLTGVKHPEERVKKNSEAQKKRFETEDVWNKGKQTGNQYTRCPKYDPAQVIDLYQSGLSMLQVAKQLEISKKSVLNTLTKHNIPTRPARGSDEWKRVRGN